MADKVVITVEVLHITPMHLHQQVLKVPVHNSRTSISTGSARILPLVKNAGALIIIKAIKISSPKILSALINNLVCLKKNQECINPG